MLGQCFNTISLQIPYFDGFIHAARQQQCTSYVEPVDEKCMLHVIFAMGMTSFMGIYLTQVTELPCAAIVSTHSAFIVCVPVITALPQRCSYSEMWKWVLGNSKIPVQAVGYLCSIWHQSWGSRLFEVSQSINTPQFNRLICSTRNGRIDGCITIGRCHSKSNWISFSFNVLHKMWEQNGIQTIRMI